MCNYLDLWVWAVDTATNISAIYVEDEDTRYTFWRYNASSEIVEIAYVSYNCSSVLSIYMYIRFLKMT